MVNLWFGQFKVTSIMTMHSAVKNGALSTCYTFRKVFLIQNIIDFIIKTLNYFLGNNFKITLYIYDS